jgi:hypothetical protein
VLVKEYRQIRLFSSLVSQPMDHSKCLDDASIIAELINKVTNCKRNDGRYSNLIK